MKIGLFIHRFTKTEYYKDHGVITSALKNIGHSVNVLCFRTDDFTIKNLKPDVISEKQSKDINFWKQYDIDCIIIYSWLSLRYTKMIEAISNAGIKVVLKLDSDGELIYPDKPTYMSAFGLNNSLKGISVHIIRLFQWYIVPKLISKIRIKQMVLSHRIIIESPIAKDRLAKSLNYWKQPQLIHKIKVIENPIEWSDNKQKKENRILCIGRWDDKQKNPKGLIKILNKLSTNWEISIIGKNAKKVHSKIKNRNLKLTSVDELPHSELINLMSTSKIIFVPSLWESFCLVAAEGLCHGCSIVSGPIAPLIHLASKDSGSIAKNFSSKELSQTLLTEMSKWEDNYYSKNRIVEDWRSILDPKIIATKISKLCGTK